MWVVTTLQQYQRKWCNVFVCRFLWCSSNNHIATIPKWCNVFACRLCTSHLFWLADLPLIVLIFLPNGVMFSVQSEWQLILLVLSTLLIHSIETVIQEIITMHLSPLLTHKENSWYVIPRCLVCIHVNEWSIYISLLWRLRSNEQCTSKFVTH